MGSGRIRLYVDHPLSPGQSLTLSDAQAHYATAVMRLPDGAEVLAFNGRDGEWLCQLARAGKRGAALTVDRQTRPQDILPDVWLLFAPLKKTRTDFVVEKAVELGARRILPVQTDHTNAERIRRDRLQAHAVEAAEQCGATTVPQIADLASLAEVLAAWDEGRVLYFADEAQSGRAVPVTGVPGEAAAILIGPEGGFSAVERKRLLSLPFVRPLTLGPRILRAETAAVAALALWQAAAGDWG